MNETEYKVEKQTKRLEENSNVNTSILIAFLLALFVLTEILNWHRYKEIVKILKPETIEATK